MLYTHLLVVCTFLLVYKDSGKKWAINKSSVYLLRTRNRVYKSRKALYKRSKALYKSSKALYKSSKAQTSVT